jgi:hypothetical protein
MKIWQKLVVALAASAGFSLLAGMVWFIWLARVPGSGVIPRGPQPRRSRG